MKQFELFYPVKPYTVTQKFGENSEYYSRNIPGLIGHNGEDVMAIDGQDIRAAHDGIVTLAGEDGSGGLGIVIRTTEEYEWLDNETCFYKTIYWHIKPNSFKVKVGDSVKAGDILAGADNTGFSTGTHLHFGIKPVKKGEEDWAWGNLEQNNGYFGAINPKPFFNGYYAQDAQTTLRTLELIISLLKQIVELLTKQLTK